MDTRETEVRATVARVVVELGNEPGPLISILRAVQDAFGYVPPSAVPLIADGLNLSRADVHGVISFYHYFRDTPPGRHTIRVCRAEACQSMQGRALEAHAVAALGADFHETTSDGTFSMEPVYCLGNCALSPAVMIDDEIYGRVTPSRFDELTKEWASR